MTQTYKVSQPPPKASMMPGIPVGKARLAHVQRQTVNYHMN